MVLSGGLPPPNFNPSCAYMLLQWLAIYYIMVVSNNITMTIKYNDTFSSVPLYGVLWSAPFNWPYMNIFRAWLLCVKTFSRVLFHYEIKQLCTIIRVLIVGRVEKNPKSYFVKEKNGKLENFLGKLVSMDLRFL